MFCENCGANVPDNSKFCIGCGKKLMTWHLPHQLSTPFKQKHPLTHSRNNNITINRQVMLPIRQIANRWVLETT